MKMRKTSLLLALGLALVLVSAATPKANAGVVVGGGIGTSGYVRTMRPYPYVVPAPVYPRVYVAPAPVYYRNWYPRRYIVRRDFHRDWR
jgi:hypothetical protein